MADTPKTRTSLSPEEESRFQSWYRERALKAGIDPDPDNPLHKYDYRGAFKAGVEPEISKEDNKYHWPSAFKDDDHPNRYVPGFGDTKKSSVYSSIQNEVDATTSQMYSVIDGITAKPASYVERFNGALKTMLEFFKNKTTMSGGEHARAITNNTLGMMSLPRNTQSQLLDSQLAEYFANEAVKSHPLPVINGNVTPEATLVGRKPDDNALQRMQDYVDSLEKKPTASTTPQVPGEEDNTVAPTIATNIAIQTLLGDVLKNGGYNMEKPFYASENIPSMAWSALFEFAPFRYTWETRKYGFIPTIDRVRGMSNEEKLAFAQDLSKQMIADGVKPLTALSVWDRLFGATTETREKIQTGVFTVLDVYASTLGVAKVPTLLRNLRRTLTIRHLQNSPQILRAMGFERVAADIVASTVLDPNNELVKATGLDKVAAAMSASPFPFQSLNSNVVQGISARTLKSIEESRLLSNYYINKGLNKFITESAGFLRPDEIPAAYSAIMAGMPEYAQVVDATPFGVQIRVTIRPPDVKSVEEARLVLDNAKLSYEKAVNELDIHTGSDLVGLEPDMINNLGEVKRLAKEALDKAQIDLDMAMKPPRYEDKFVWYTRDNFNGTFNGVMEVNPVKVKVVSPEVYLASFDNQVVPERTVILAKEEQMHKLFKDAYREIVWGLDKQEMDNVNHVLQHGDDTRQLFNTFQLEVGVDVPGVGTVRLNKAEMAAYYKTRDALDALHELRSVMKRRQLGWRGYDKEVYMNVGDKRWRAFGKLVKKVPGDTKWVYDARLGRVAKFSEADHANKPELVVLKTEQPIRVDKYHLDYVIANGDDVKDINGLTRVLPKDNPGYVPRIYDRVPYVVRQAVKITRYDGSQSTIYETKAFFHNRDAASRWAELQGKDHIANSDWDWRIQDPTFSKSMDEAVFAGRFEDHRGPKIPYGMMDEQHNITFGEAPRLSAMAALDKYMNNLAWAYPMNEWRTSVIDRYINTVGDYLSDRHIWNSPIRAGTDLKPEQQSAIYAMRDYLQQQLSIQNEGERVFGRTLQVIAERMDNAKPGGLKNKIRMGLLYGRDFDGYALLRNLTWRIHLGLGNPAQLIVQAHNAMQVFILHPQNAPQVLRRVLALRTVAFATPDMVGYDTLMKIAARSAGMRVEDFKPLAHAFMRSGMGYTARSSADVAMAMHHMSTGGDVRRLVGMTDKALQATFLEGELFARIYGFIDSYLSLHGTTVVGKNTSKWKHLNVKLFGAGTKRELTLTEINNLTKEAFRVSYNFTQANRAWWQSGLPSLGTQFMAPTAKFYEELYLPLVSSAKRKSRFSPVERGQLIFGNMLMYGLAGVPLGTVMAGWIGHLLSDGKDPNDKGLSMDQAVKLYGGANDWLASELVTWISGLGGKEHNKAYPMISYRGALASGIDVVWKNIAGPDATLQTAALGAFRAIPTRTTQAMHEMLLLQGSQFSMDWTQTDVLGAIDILGGIATSWNNVRKYRLWKTQGKVYNSKGEVVMDLDLEKDQAMMGSRLFGITDWREQWARDQMNEVQRSNPDTEIKDISRDLELLAMHYMSNNIAHTYDDVKQYAYAKTKLLEAASSRQIAEAAQEAYGSKLLDTSTVVGKTYQKYIDATMRGDVGPNPLIVDPQALKEENR